MIHKIGWALALCALSLWLFACEDEPDQPKEATRKKLKTTKRRKQLPKTLALKTLQRDLKKFQSLKKKRAALLNKMRAVRTYSYGRVWYLPEQTTACPSKEDDAKAKPSLIWVPAVSWRGASVWMELRVIICATAWVRPTHWEYITKSKRFGRPLQASAIWWETKGRYKRTELSLSGRSYSLLGWQREWLQALTSPRKGRLVLHAKENPLTFPLNAKQKRSIKQAWTLYQLAQDLAPFHKDWFRSLRPR